MSKIIMSKKSDQEIRRLRAQVEALKAQAKLYSKKESFKIPEKTSFPQKQSSSPVATLSVKSKLNEKDFTKFVKRDLVKSLVVSVLCFGIIFAFYFKLIPLP